MAYSLCLYTIIVVSFDFARMVQTISEFCQECLVWDLDLDVRDNPKNPAYRTQEPRRNTLWEK